MMNYFTIRFIFCWAILCLYYTGVAQQDRPKTGLVLSGGGALGLAHIGVLEYLEEMGVEIDLIGGTSMGGIVAGLYAIGYKSYQLDTIARTQDWGRLLSNEFDRKRAPMRLKDDQDRYILTLRREESGISFSSALVNGMNIYQLFQQLCYPVSAVRDFNQFEIPFYCVAVNLDTEEQVILDDGYLPDALSATMAIPGFFQPIVIDGQELVDGGILNNLPMNEMRSRGANTVIGVSLVDKDTTKISAGFSSVLSKTYGVIMKNARSVYEGDCDICIEVDISGYNLLDFQAADTLIARGKRAAAAVREQLLQLKQGQVYKLMGFAPIFARKLPTPSLDSLEIKDIRITGNKNIPKKAILKDLQLKPETAHTISNIQQGIEQLQASGRFNRVYYKFPDQNSQDLEIVVDELTEGLLRLGLNYDTDFGAAILINPSLKNVLGFGSLIEVEFRLDRNPYLNLNYQVNTQNAITPEVNLSVLGEEYYNYINSDEFDINRSFQVAPKVGIYWNLHPSVDLRLGLEGQWYDTANNARPSILEGLTSPDNLWNFYFQLNTDFMDHSLYPRQGTATNLSVKVLTTDLISYSQDRPAMWLSFQHRQVFALTKQLVLMLEGQLGYSSEDVAPQFRFYQGGMNRHQRNNLILQPGLPLMRQTGLTGVVGNVKLRYDLPRGNFVYLDYTASSIDNDFGQVWANNWANGISIGYEFRNPISPIKLYLATPTNQLDLTLFLLAGFDF